MPRALLATTLVFGLAGRALAEGPLVLAGGKMKDPAIYEEIVRLAGTAPRVAIVTAASANYELENGRDEERAFRRAGAGTATWIDLASPTAALELGEADVIFFGGGDQLRLLRLLRRHGLDGAVRRAHQRGAVIAGTSAGTAVQTSAPMITGNRPTWERGGLGLFRHGLLDTHFSQRNREGRLLALARATNTPLAFGIDENTALVVDRGRMRVIGRNRVLMYTGAGRGQRLILTPGRDPARSR